MARETVAWINGVTAALPVTRTLSMHDPEGMLRTAAAILGASFRQYGEEFMSRVRTFRHR
jgi:hypothetical protein